MKTLCVLFCLMCFTAAADPMTVAGTVNLAQPAEEKPPADKKYNVIDALQSMIEGKQPAGTFCFASVQTDTVVCRRDERYEVTRTETIFLVGIVVLSALLICAACYATHLERVLAARPERLIICFPGEGIPLTIPDECEKR